MARRIALAAALLALAATSGCEEKDLPAGKLTPEVRALLAHVPGDARLVAGVDLALARSSGLWDQALADAIPKLVAVGHQCGAHLITEIDRLIVSSPEQQPDARRLFIVVAGRFSASGKSCLDEIATLREASATWKDGVAIVTPTALAASARGAVTSSPEMLARIEKADTGGVLWLAADTRGGSRAGGMSMPPELHGLAISIRPQGDGVAGAARLEVDSEDRARATADLFRDQKDRFSKGLLDPRLGDIVRHIAVTQKGSEVAFELAVNRAELEHLLDLRAMLGGS
jgi:hypothetical protein